MFFEDIPQDFGEDDEVDGEEGEAKESLYTLILTRKILVVYPESQLKSFKQKTIRSKIRA